jgi:GT2 family glycosyltransferase
MDTLPTTTNSANLDFVLITPARNEAAFIERTIHSVLAQTRTPRRWIVVSDGSTDGTDDIVRRYTHVGWIQLLRLPGDGPRNFAAKVRAFEAGLALLQDVPYDVIGNVDADVSFPPDFFAYLLDQFAGDPKLGVAGTHYVEGDFNSFRDSFINPAHVNGQCQLFRRACFEDIGGYVPIEGGGIDWVAVTTARMKGWTTRSFGERVFEHHRTMGTAGGNELRARYAYGKKDYALGGHPMWQLLRGSFQLTKPPYLLGGILLLAGYFGCWLKRAPRAISPELMAFHRREQLERINGLLRRSSMARGAGARAANQPCAGGRA